MASAERTSDLASRPKEDVQFLSRHLITYLGNKRALLPPIRDALDTAVERVGRPLHTVDAFSGSGAVARLLKGYSQRLVVNDLEPYAAVLARCYLANRSDVDLDAISTLCAEFNRRVDDAPSQGGFIERLYAPGDDAQVQPGERVFYTRDNARRLDHYARLIHGLEEDVKPLLLGPLLVAASVHANTAGVFKGFYKDKATGIGQFGGSGQDALRRITGRIELEPPILSRVECEVEVRTDDANALVRELEDLDLAYFDPPYNEHPYGSNYFMLNLLTHYQEPAETSLVSGIPTDWQRSGYNQRRRSLALMTDLTKATNARFLLISFNDEGFIAPEEMAAMLADLGEVTEHQTPYNTFRGSRNLAQRRTHVTEHLYLVDRG